MFVSILRKHIGTIISVFGFMILCILTFGDITEIATEEYWQNVWSNITSIGFMTISLTTIQVTIKQGLSEQALQRGLNTEVTRQKYEEHKKIISDNTSRLIYVPYFLQVYNQRMTKLRKHEFLLSNGFKSEVHLFTQGKKKLKKLYKLNPIKLPFHELVIVLSGTLHYTIDGEEVTLSDGEIAYIPQGHFCARKVVDVDVIVSVFVLLILFFRNVFLQVIVTAATRCI